MDYKLRPPNQNASAYEGYHAFTDENGNDHGSFEVFWDSEQLGWFWWACFPDCLPDGDPFGPFDTSKDAHDNAQELD